MAKREVVIGGELGQIISAAHSALVTDARQSAMSAIGRLPEANRDYLTQRFTLGEAYSLEPRQQEIARTVIEFPKALFPEEELGEWSVERGEVTIDSNPKGQPGERRIEGVVLFRFEERRNESSSTVAIRVQLMRHYEKVGDKITYSCKKPVVTVIGSIRAIKRTFETPLSAQKPEGGTTVGPVRRIWPSTKPGPAAAETG